MSEENLGPIYLADDLTLNLYVLDSDTYKAVFVHEEGEIVRFLTSAETMDMLQEIKRGMDAHDAGAPFECSLDEFGTAERQLPN